MSIRSDEHLGKRKIGGSVVLSDTLRVDSSPELHADSGVQETGSPACFQCDLPKEVALVISEGLDGLLQLVLTSSKEDKLNKSNLKFKRFENIFKYCKFDENEFFYIKKTNNPETANVIAEISRQLRPMDTHKQPQDTRTQPMDTLAQIEPIDTHTQVQPIAALTLVQPLATQGQPTPWITK